MRVARSGSRVTISLVMGGEARLTSVLFSARDNRTAEAENILAGWVSVITNLNGGSGSASVHSDGRSAQISRNRRPFGRSDPALVVRGR